MQLKNPGKQRKRHFNAPAHIRHKKMAAPLSRSSQLPEAQKPCQYAKATPFASSVETIKGSKAKFHALILKLTAYTWKA